MPLSQYPVGLIVPYSLERVRQLIENGEGDQLPDPLSNIIWIRPSGLAEQNAESLGRDSKKLFKKSKNLKKMEELKSKELVKDSSSLDNSGGKVVRRRRKKRQKSRIASIDDVLSFSWSKMLKKSTIVKLEGELNSAKNGKDGLFEDDSPKSKPLKKVTFDLKSTAESLIINPKKPKSRFYFHRSQKSNEPQNETLLSSGSEPSISFAEMISELGWKPDEEEDEECKETLGSNLSGILSSKLLKNEKEGEKEDPFASMSDEKPGREENEKKLTSIIINKDLSRRNIFELKRLRKGSRTPQIDYLESSFLGPCKRTMTPKPKLKSSSIFSSNKNHKKISPVLVRSRIKKRRRNQTQNLNNQQKGALLKKIAPTKQNSSSFEVRNRRSVKPRMRARPNLVEPKITITKEESQVRKGKDFRLGTQSVQRSRTRIHPERVSERSRTRVSISGKKFDNQGKDQDLQNLSPLRTLGILASKAATEEPSASSSFLPFFKTRRRRKGIVHRVDHQTLLSASQQGQKF